MSNIGRMGQRRRICAGGTAGTRASGERGLNETAFPELHNHPQGRIADRPAGPLSSAVRWPETESGLTLALVYEDSATLAWAQETTSAVVLSMGESSVRTASWKVADLIDTNLLGEAVVAATRADVIIASVYAAEELAWQFYVWVDAWLPRRLQAAGAFVAMVGVSPLSEPHFFRTIDYLCAVARKGGLEFTLYRRQAAQSEFDPAILSFDRSSEVANNGYSHWGLNE